MTCFERSDERLIGEGLILVIIAFLILHRAVLVDQRLLSHEYRYRSDISTHVDKKFQAYPMFRSPVPIRYCEGENGLSETMPSLSMFNTR